ncbi:hypothetical protein CFC21_106375 [Triticum aestivum]|uniref:NB-ARC domain-containing protein n=2 Tax=Triticum aestivum TaxID=4565 RepID=A0A9R1MDZ9_WHEAT|nr:hypothetical protein CFC21_106375 [Triticum aestivum]
MEATVLSVGKSVVIGALNCAKSAVAEEVALQLGVQRDHVFITDELEMMQAFLMAAHEEEDDNKVIKTWVKQVRDVAYDVEDCLQDLVVRLEKLSWWRLPFMLLYRRSVAKQMKDLRAKVEDISQRNVRYRLIVGSAASKIKPTTAAAEQSAIKTEVLLHISQATRSALLEKEKKKVDLVKLVMEDKNDLRVIAVWGASSNVGVTSIIRAAYDNASVRGQFQCRAWVRMIQPFHPNDFFVSMVRQFYEGSCEENGKSTEGTTTTGLKVLEKMKAQDNLVHEFNRYVTDKSYLVVINDVATIEEWDWIKTYFPSKKGSRIVVSTQHFEVASLCTEQPYTATAIDQKWSSDKDFYVFHKKVDSKPESGSKSVMGSASSSAAVGGEDEQVQNPTRASTVAAALEEDQLINRPAANAKVMKLVHQGRREVITVCGMGGLGKTTLLTSLWQQELGKGFQRRAWLTISSSFNSKEFHRDLLQQLDDDCQEGEGNADIPKMPSESVGNQDNEAQMIQDLIKILWEQKCLLVFDDVSSIVDWQLILQLLPTSRNVANRIIVTTRELNVAKCCSLDEEQIYNLELLDDAEALLLFEKKVIFRATAMIRSWSLLTPMAAREHLVTGSIRWEMVTRDIFNRFGWRSCNRIGN